MSLKSYYTKRSTIKINYITHYNRGRDKKLNSVPYIGVGQCYILI